MMFFFKGGDFQVQKPFVFQSELAWNPKIEPLSLWHLDFAPNVTMFEKSSVERHAQYQWLYLKFWGDICGAEIAK